MASQEYILTAQREADDRVSVAIATLTERSGVEAVAMPSLPNQIARDYRTMVATQTIAETLERLVTATTPEVPNETDVALREQAIEALGDNGIDLHTAELFADVTVFMAGMHDGDIEAAASRIAVAFAPPETPTDDAPDPSAMTRDELDTLATSLGIADADKLPNKAAVVDAITAAREA